MKQLIVHLPAGAAPQTVETWLRAADGSLQVHSQALESLAPARDSEVVLVLPAQCLSWHRVALPPKLKLGEAVAASAVHALLEDGLLQGQEQLHIALAPDARAGAATLVAVCDRQWLQAWWTVLEQAGLQIARLLPQVPPDVLRDGDMLCTGSLHDAWATRRAAEVLLSLPLVAGMLDGAQVAQLQALPGAYTDAQACAAVPVQLLEPAAYATTLLGSRWDLAQFTFASTPWLRWRRKLREAGAAVLHAPQWRAVRWAGATSLLALLIGANYQAWSLARQVQAASAAIEASVRSSFPQVRVVLDAPVQMARELAELQQLAGQVQPGDFEPMLAAAGAALHGTDQPTTLQYGDTVLRLGGLGEAVFQRMQAPLQGAGYQAQRVDGAVEITVNR